MNYEHGPWKYEDEEVTEDGHYEAPRVFSMADPDHPKLICELGVYSRMHGNGKLIECAPEMAEMLLSMFVHVSHGGPTIAEAEALLKKAGAL